MPKLRINSGGGLEYYRKAGWKPQFCINTENGACGDTCPLFEEPVYDLEDNNRVVKLKICEKEFILEPRTEFTDHRVKQD